MGFGAWGRGVAFETYLHFITSTFLSGPTDTFDPRWIGMVEDVSTLGDYRWGDLGYATLVG